MDKVLSNTNKYAGFGIRLLAQLIDRALFFLLQVLPLYFISLSLKDFSSAFNSLLWFMTILTLMSLMGLLLYFSWVTAKFGGTPAKLLLGLKVTDESGKNLTFLKSFFRHTIGYSVSSLFFGVGYYWIIRDKKMHQAWHDIVSGSFVINAKKGSRIVLGSLLFIVLTILSTYFCVASIRNIVNNEALKGEVERAKELMTPVIKEEQPVTEPMTIVSGQETTQKTIQMPYIQTEPVFVPGVDRE